MGVKHDIIKKVMDWDICLPLEPEAAHSNIQLEMHIYTKPGLIKLNDFDPETNSVDMMLVIERMTELGNRMLVSQCQDCKYEVLFQPVHMNRVKGKLEWKREKTLQEAVCSAALHNLEVTCLE